MGEAGPGRWGPGKEMAFQGLAVEGARGCLVNERYRASTPVCFGLCHLYRWFAAPEPLVYLLACVHGSVHACTHAHVRA